MKIIIQKVINGWIMKVKHNNGERKNDDLYIFTNIHDTIEAIKDIIRREK